MSPTAYRRSVSVGCCSRTRCTLHECTFHETSSSTPITRSSFELSTEYQPGQDLSRVDEAGSRPGSIRVAVEKLDASSEQRPRLRVCDGRKLGLGAGNVKPAQRYHDDVRRERGQLVPGTGSRRLAGGASDVLAP